MVELLGMVHLYICGSFHHEQKRLQKTGASNWMTGNFLCIWIV
jgi:hypothetical protein